MNIKKESSRQDIKSFIKFTISIVSMSTRTKPDTSDIFTTNVNHMMTTKVFSKGTLFTAHVNLLSNTSSPDQ